MSEVDDSLLIQDQSSRARALEPASFIVEAPAGAGKTELLTQRFLRLLATVEEPEEVVAITFTLKAAGEMKNRILESLERAATGVTPEAEHKRITQSLAQAVLAASADRGWGLMEQPGRLRVQTIDAFCMALSRQMPVLSGLGAQPRLARDARLHHMEAARRTLALLEDGDEALAQPVADALRHVDNDLTRLRELLAEMLGRRDQWLGHALAAPTRDDMEAVLAALIERDLGHAAVTLAPWLARVRPLALAAAARLGPESPIAALTAWEAPLHGDVEELPLWLGLCDLVLTASGTRRATVNKNQGFPPEAKTDKADFLDALADLPPAAVDALARLRELPPGEMSDEEWAAVAALSRLLVLAAAQLMAVFQEAGELDFIEVAQRALLALGPEDAPTDLSLMLDYRISHLLVDEFQDTSPTQVDLLRRLTAGWQAGDGKTLFLVGDPMQSIYRFRQADVGLFLQAARQGLPNVPLTSLRLNRNNRSRPGLVDWVNRVFPGVFPAEDSVERSAIAYRASLATREAAEGAGIAVHALVVAEGEAGEALQARRVLDLIRQERQRDPEHSIAVLVRKRRQLNALVAEIRRHEPGLPFTAVEIESLAERQVVQDLLALTRALHHRADRVNWLALLRAPWCGLTLADLHALAGDNHIATVWRLMNEAARVARLSADGQARLGFVRGVLAEAFAHRGRQSSRRWVEGVWRCLGGVGLLRDAAEATDALAFLDLIDKLDAAGGFTPDALEAAIADLYAAPAPDADPRLQFMTIHKSKGLEFDCVILPDLNDGTSGGSQPLIAWESVALDGLEESLIAAPLTKAAAGPSVYRSLRRLEKEREENESARQLYVAVTRARERLHLVGYLAPNAKDERKAAAGSFLALLWPVLGAEFEAAAVIEAETRGTEEGSFAPLLIRAAAPSMPAELAAPDGLGGASGPLPGESEEGASTLDADIGTLVHAYLERIAIDGPEDWSPVRCAQLTPAMEVWLARRGHEGAALTEGLARVGDSLRCTLESAEGRWVLARRADAAAELVLARAEARGFSTHIVDRTFVEDGVRWIADYKTARPSGDEASLLAHAEGYREQLQRYASLFRDEGLPIRAGIFYTALGRWIALGELS